MNNKLNNFMHLCEIKKLSKSTKPMILLTKLFLLKIILFILIKQQISCDCGPPGKPIGAEIKGNRKKILEFAHVIYYCKKEFKLFYAQRSYRKCIKGEWNRPVPKCGKSIIIEKSFEIIKNQYYINFFNSFK